MTTDTLISRVQFDLGQRDCDNRFSTWLFYILVCLFLFVFFTIYCRSCYEGALKKKSDVKWLPFFNILENVSTFSEKKKFGRLYFLINSWRVIFSWPLRCRCVWFRYCLYSRDPAKFPCKIVLHGVSQEFSENFFALICTFFGAGDGGEWLQKRGSGRVKPNLFIARGQSAFQSGQTDYLSPFFTQTTSQFSQDTPSSTSFFAKFIAYVTSGWKFDRTDQTALCFKIASVI